MTHISIDIEEGTARAESGGGIVVVPLDPVMARVGVPGLPGRDGIAALKPVVAASSDFEDFKARVAAL